MKMVKNQGDKISVSDSSYSGYQNWNVKPENPCIVRISM